MIARRLAKLEATNKKQDREYVVCVRDGETTREALDRFFEPYGGERWPVAVIPEPCETEEQWLERYARKRVENR
jgi:hypothetical protein